VEELIAVFIAKHAPTAVLITQGGKEMGQVVLTQRCDHRQPLVLLHSKE